LSNQTLFLLKIETYPITMKKILFALLICCMSYAQDVSLRSGTVREKNYYQEIPIEIIMDKVIIPVVIEGTTYHFILDTGAPNLISKRIIKAINSKPIVKTAVRDGNTTKDSLDVINIPLIQLGNLNFENQIAMVSDLEHHPFLKCYGVDGLIGSNLFTNSILKISLKDKKITITDKIKTLSPQQKPKEMQVIAAQGKPCIWIEYQGNEHKKVREQVLIDTGMDGFYDLSNRSYAFLKKEGIYQVIGKSVGVGDISLFGTGQQHEQELINIPFFKINQTTFNNVTTNTHEEHTSGIGLNFFKYGDGILDFINKKFYWEEAETTINMKPAEKFSCSYINNNYVVDFVWDETLKTKIKAGDVIIRIDQLNIKKMTTCDLLNLRKYLADKNTYEMEVQKEDTSTVTVTISH
jgi:predicted aspartyl protease